MSANGRVSTYAEPRRAQASSTAALADAGQGTGPGRWSGGCGQLGVQLGGGDVGVPEHRLQGR